MKGYACGKGAYVTSWQVAFVQDCNLRCDYCVTGFGALGGPAGVMNAETQEHFIERAFAWMGDEKSLSLTFGCGETFLFFEDFAHFIERLQAEAGNRGIALDLRLSTNGTRLDDERLRWCLANRIQLSFSIDGSAAVHDRHRPDQQGAGSHARAVAAWRRYRELAHDYPRAGAARIRSVIAEGERLADAIAFWDAEGAVLFDPTIEEPSDFAEDRRATWDARRDGYLQDLEAHALRYATQLSVPHFLRDYRGPAILLELWMRLFVGGTAGSCGAGCSTLALDCRGDIYPCEGFLGRTKWRIGSLEQGLDQEAVARLGAAVTALRRPCASCSERDLCDGGCLAADPGRSLSLNARGGCRFLAEVVAIARRSYAILEGQAA